VLAEADLIAAEDTRHTGVLLKRLGIDSPLLSYHSFNERARREQLLAALREGDVALVSDAGTPGISDPGAMLVRAAVEAGFPVVPIPGPSAIAAAMSISGFEDGPALFLGFLPRAKSQRTALLGQAASSSFAFYCFESPRRAAATLGEIASVVGQREVALFRELTKVHETVLRGSAREVLAQLGDKVRGEVVIGVGPGSAEPPAEEVVRRMLAGELTAGASVSQAAREIAARTGIPRSRVYAMAIELSRNPSSGQPA
jgi:16S rRNA (cytidine1402-2'-O)-methyltransferase